MPGREGMAGHINKWISNGRGQLTGRKADFGRRSEEEKERGGRNTCTLLFSIGGTL